MFVGCYVTLITVTGVFFLDPSFFQIQYWRPFIFCKNPVLGRKTLLNQTLINQITCRIVLVTRPGATQTVPRGLWERCQSGDPTLNPAVINYRRSKTRKIASAGLATQTTEVAWRPLPTGTLPPLPPPEGAPEPETSCSGTTSVPGCWKSWPPRTTLTTSFQSWPSS